LPERMTGASKETNASSAGSSGQTITTTPVGSGKVKLKCELATGFTERAARRLHRIAKIFARRTAVVCEHGPS